MNDAMSPSTRLGGWVELAPSQSESVPPNVPPVPAPGPAPEPPRPDDAPPDVEEPPTPGGLPPITEPPASHPPVAMGAPLAGPRSAEAVWRPADNGALNALSLRRPPVEYPQYNPLSDNLPLSDDELQALDQQLQGLPGRQAMNIENLDGYLTALLVGPFKLSERPGADWLPAVWGGDGASDGNAPFASSKQRKRATLLVLRHLRHLDGQLKEAVENPAAWQPIFSVAEVQDKEWVDAEDWCAGFLRAVELAPQAWGEYFDDAALGPALVPIALLGGDDSELSAADAERLADPEVCDELSRAAADAVLMLHEHARAR